VLVYHNTAQLCENASSRSNVCVRGSYSRSLHSEDTVLLRMNCTLIAVETLNTLRHALGLSPYALLYNIIKPQVVIARSWNYGRVGLPCGVSIGIIAMIISPYHHIVMHEV
jgi:hypothetical protein